MKLWAVAVLFIFATAGGAQQKKADFSDEFRTPATRAYLAVTQLSPVKRDNDNFEVKLYRALQEVAEAEKHIKTEHDQHGFELLNGTMVLITFWRENSEYGETASHCIAELVSVFDPSQMSATLTKHLQPGSCLRELGEKKEDMQKILAAQGKPEAPARMPENAQTSLSPGFVKAGTLAYRALSRLPVIPAPDDGFESKLANATKAIDEAKRNIKTERDQQVYSLLNGMLLGLILAREDRSYLRLGVACEGEAEQIFDPDTLKQRGERPLTPGICLLEYDHKREDIDRRLQQPR